MIRKKLFRGIPFALALGLIIAPAITAHAESYGTGLTRAIDEDIDSGFMIKPEVFINNEEFSADNIEIISNGAYLPLEAVAFKMGDRLEGSADDTYMLRTNDKMLIMNIKNNTYKLNGENNTVQFYVKDDVAYAPINFFKEVLGYEMNLDGNNVYFGQANENVSMDLSGDYLIDDTMMVNPEIYINSDRYPDFGIKIHNGEVYLPLEVVTEKMGDRLEGDFSTQYYLRKSSMMLMIDFMNNKYILNGVEHDTNMIRVGRKVYASLDFYKDVLNYAVKEDGNSFYIGEIKEKEVLPNTIADGKWSLENGSWYYLSGEKRATGWVRDNNKWYYLKSDGSMATGWVKDQDKWYLLNSSGAMETGWVIDNGNAYYLNKDGSMAAGTIVDGFMLAENGVSISLY